MADQPRTRLEVVDDATPVGAVAVLTLDDPAKSANILSASVLEEIETHLDALAERSDLAGLVFVSEKPGIFIAGADLTSPAGAALLRSRKVVPRDPGTNRNRAGYPCRPEEPVGLALALPPTQVGKQANKQINS